MADNLDKFQHLQSLPVSVAVLDATGRIVAVNEAWKAFGETNGLCLPDFGVGESYFKYCETGQNGAGQLSAQLTDLLAGRCEMITMVYPCDSPSKQRWFFLIGMPLSVERPNGAAILHAELTSLLPMASARDTARATGTLIDPSAAVLGGIEQSVTDALVSQLQTMFEASRGFDREDVDPATKLSKRQLEVLKLLGEGKSNAEIAQTLFRSPHTIKLHVSAILKQLNLKSRTQAALLASKLWPGEK
ncbi:LuxR C-terminal-related transcriptional regulator [Hyphomicrobium sp.]|uniref:LuxR C-terminal-related transcriptional regulator n=1 Tax=Hyphomicrobium sp. TaxID=82 RepID=UPI002E31CC29|nr:LuxR C-terminal-related transcriptional regulator [Hyphomicrobium sp.]HEX2842624.1 LuxR C-terminal-related transcriptional regulator [Hyphomicrobium sp.]